VKFSLFSVYGTYTRIPIRSDIPLSVRLLSGTRFERRGIQVPAAIQRCGTRREVEHAGSRLRVATPFFSLKPKPCRQDAYCYNDRRVGEKVHTAGITYMHMRMCMYM
jgi:hypothetical protein